MKRDRPCEEVLHLHRTFRPRRRTGRGFLTGTVFLDAALLFSAFVLAISPFVRKPGIELELPIARESAGIRHSDRVLSITRTGLFFFNDEQILPGQLDAVFRVSVEERPGAALIVEAHHATPQSTLASVYDAASRSGFSRILIATRSGPSPATP